jgi:predicted PurR-regulated permease PerM
MKEQAVLRDERTVSVENASYRLANQVMSIGLLLSTAYRAHVLHEQSWDLLALLVLGGVVATAYQGFHQALPQRWLPRFLGIMAVAAVVAALLVRFVAAR